MQNIRHKWKLNPPLLIPEERATTNTTHSDCTVRMSVSTVALLLLIAGERWGWSSNPSASRRASRPLGHGVPTTQQTWRSVSVLPVQAMAETHRTSSVVDSVETILYLQLAIYQNNHYGHSYHSKVAGHTVKAYQTYYPSAPSYHYTNQPTHHYCNIPPDLWCDSAQAASAMWCSTSMRCTTFS
ncbi:hypothetical protein KIN20_004006 [Parelaphostrongylus tenuis]|uniref:Uncharacterized protein n=1 Tax=Parelaphostrongylus tenuis TaxID=148309 RepID=A0AAD5QHR4_PARTN|nr:hypothetical protein KIN20_004006 [Parelaphostrongylus tenuis]